MDKIQTFYHTGQASVFDCDIICKFRSSLPDVLFNNSCYKNFEHFGKISEVKLVKLGNECLQLH